MRTITRLPPVARLLAAALLALILLSIINTANAAWVQGRILYNNGILASDIAVRLTTTNGVVVTPFTYSVRGGRFYLNNVTAGTYSLEFWKNRVRVKKIPSITVTEPGLDVRDVRLP